MLKVKRCSTPQALSQERTRMKYCPFCGAALMGGAVSYCAECGSILEASESAAPGKKLKRGTKKFKRKALKPMREQTQEPVEDGYDGYYDDVQPIDSGCIHDRLDPELIKRIIIISVGAAVIVLLSVLAMYLL